MWRNEIIARLWVNTAKDGTGSDVMPIADSDGHLQVDVVASVLPSGIATANNQTGGSQKTQIVDGSGNVIGSTSNALDIQIKNASIAGVAGTPNANVISVQGVAGGTTLPVTEASASAIKSKTDNLDILLSALRDAITGTSPNNKTLNDLLTRLNLLLADATFTGRIGEVQTTPTTNTVLARLKDLLTGISLTTSTAEIGNVKNSGTFAVQQSALTAVTNATLQLTLTSPATAYQTTAPASPYLLVMCNNSDTDMKWGFATATATGILLAKSGGSIAMILAASKAPFINCTGTGKVLDYTTSIL